MALESAVNLGMVNGYRFSSLEVFNGMNSPGHNKTFSLWLSEVND